MNAPGLNRVPPRIGKYPIRRILGEGAMGVVYEAFDPVIQRSLAIKTIRRELIDGNQSGEMAIARFKNEAKAAGRLSHPGIAAVYEYGEDDDCTYIAMEFVAGHTLREYAARSVNFCEQDVVAIMVQLLDALDYAHRNGVWHRDMKPANVMLTQSGTVKVTDFGIARIEAQGLTMDGSMLGTPGYMAPEQYRGGDIDHRVDIYAAGALLYHMLCGTAPFAGTLESVMFRTVTEDPPPLSSTEKGAAWGHFEPVLSRALARERDQRFASACDFRQALIAASGKPLSNAVSDSTVILDKIPEDGRHQAAHSGESSSLHRNTSAPGTAGPGPTLFAPQTLSDLEASLARHLGPLARVLVKQAATKAQDVDTLRQMLAAHLDTAEERTTFLKERTSGANPRTAGIPTGTGSSLPGGRPAARPGSTLHAAQIDRAIQLLTPRVGPIAAILVRKSAQGAASVEALVAEIARRAEFTLDTEALAAELRKAAPQ